MIKQLFLFGWIFSAVGSIALGWAIISLHQRSGETVISFLDVGQGDAILISQGNNQVLIDGGKSGKVLLQRLSETLPFWERSIEVVVATHPDEDHIGGLVEMLSQYQVGVFLQTKEASSSPVFDALTKAQQDHQTPVIETFAGLSVTFPDEGSVLETLAPMESFADHQLASTNEASIVMRLTLASGAVFLFTGDLPAVDEFNLPRQKVTVLKAGHHGSKTSTSNFFLDAISPDDAVISVGKENRYGHPAKEVLERLTQHHVAVFRTDQDGTITYHCPSRKEAQCRVETTR
jgi:competence protein ComEC